MNEVGTFGIGTAAYWWSRLAAGAGRMSILLTHCEEFWQLLFADDYQWQFSGENGVWNILLVIFYLVLIGMPFSWKKFRGGDELDWVGYWVDYKTFCVGVSESRAKWVILWLGSMV